jgi:hypothetical protein
MNLLILKKMKKAIFTSILALLITTGTTVMGQERPDEYLGLPGDNLNLYAVMNLFQESETLEGFEKNLNEENSRINNLDLNGDNFVDYIMVTDYPDRENHNIVLSVALNSNERQDVAVFTVQKLRNGEVEIQLIGDENLYGRNYIIEPIYDDNNGGTPNPGYNGRNQNRHNVTVIRTNYYEIAAWPMIRFIYRPDYVIWRSSWHWGYYPSYWHSWSPFYYHHYYGYHSNWYPVYYQHYRHWHQPRYTRYNDFYYSSVRSYSPSVSIRIKEGNYKNTYSRPESRRDGEALYNKTRGSQDSRTSVSSRRAANTSGDRNSVSTSSRTNRRSATNGNVNSGTNSRSTNPTNANTGTNRRSANTTNTNSGTINRSTNPTSVKSGTNSRSTNSTSVESGSKSRSTNSATGQSAGTSRRSSGSASERAVSKPATVKKSESASRTRQSSTKASAPARTNTKASKSESTSRSSKAKESETTKTTKRR